MQPKLRLAELKQWSSNGSLHPNRLEVLLKQIAELTQPSGLGCGARSCILTIPRRCWCFWTKDCTLRTTQVEEHIAPLCPLIYPFLCNKVQLISLLSLGEETECAQQSNFSFHMREPGETLHEGRLCVHREEDSPLFRLSFGLVWRGNV